MKTVTLNYTVPMHFTLVVNEAGDLINFYLNDKDRGQNGDLILDAHDAIEAAGHNIQFGISLAFEKLRQKEADERDE